MKERSLCVALVLAVLLLGKVAAHAQATPTPTATPAPACSITTLPGICAGGSNDGTQCVSDATCTGGGTCSHEPECRTGAESPPVLLGVSGGNFNSVAINKTGGVSCYTGTFGALVQDSAATPSIYVLSTNHTLARTSGSGTASAKAKEVIVQPGLVDLGCWQDPTDQVAQLSKWTPINFKGGENQMDAAIAKVIDTAIDSPDGPPVQGVDPLGRILNLGQLSTTPFPRDSLIDGLPVMKMARSSCLTGGQIDAWDAFGQVVYPAGSNSASSGVSYFNHQILIIGPGCSFASPGDSGAIVVSSDFACPQAIGMVFAGSSGAGADSGGTIVAVNPIQPILKQFNVTLVGNASCTPSMLEREIDGARHPAEISDALRASIEQVRSVKETHGRRLLRQRGVVAVGIGGGDTPGSVALNVYLTQDTPEIRSRVLAEVKGTNVRFRHLRGRFKAL
jgi:hypothetical protein